MRNWIEGPNPFGLAKPSDWWLTLLHDYDADLVIFPSQRDHVYRLARRVPRQFQLGQNIAVVHQHPDTTLMITRGLVPVSTVIPWAIRSDKIIRDLRARDTWRGPHGKTGAADDTLDILEGEELRQAEQEEKAAYDKLDHVSGEAFKSLQMRKGSRTAVPGTRGPLSPRPLAKPTDKTVSSLRQPSPAGPRHTPESHNSVILTE